METLAESVERIKATARALSRDDVTVRSRGRAAPDGGDARMTVGVQRALAMGGLFVAGATMTVGAAVAVIAPNGAPGVALLLFGAGCAGAAIEFLWVSGEDRPLTSQDRWDWELARLELDERARAQEWSA